MSDISVPSGTSPAPDSGVNSPPALSEEMKSFIGDTVKATVGQSVNAAVSDHIGRAMGKLNETIETRFKEFPRVSDTKKPETELELQIAKLTEDAKNNAAKLSAFEIAKVKAEKKADSLRKHSTIGDIARNRKVTDSDAFITLVSPHLKQKEDGSLFAETNVNGYVEEIKADVFVDSFLKAKPWLVESSGTSGSGSQPAGSTTPNIGGREITPEELKNMPMSEYLTDRKQLLEQAGMQGAGELGKT